MQFKNASIQSQWNETPKSPRLVATLEGLDQFCESNKFPEVVVTDLNTPGVHGPNSDHYKVPARAVDIRAKHLSAFQLAMMDNYVTENFPRKGMSPKGYQLRSFYAHGSEATFHIHISCD